MNILKIAGIVIIVSILAYALSLLELWTQLARYQTYWSRQNDKSASANSVQYIALGDSTAQAIGASHPSKGYVGIISTELEKKYDRPVQTINLSKSGAKVKDVLITQLPDLERRGYDKDTKITIEIGANDMIKFNAVEFEIQVDELMERLPAQTVISDIPYFGESRFKSKQPNVDKANEIMYRQAAKHNRVLVPLHAKMKQNGGIKTFAPDWFHPSNTAYKQNWAPVFLEKL